MSLTIWDVSISRDRGGERWDRPRIEWPKLYRYPHSRRVGMRVGWRMTAWGLHVGRRYVSDEEYPAVLADAKASTDPCGRSFELLGDRTVRVRYSCGKVVEFGNLPPWPANDAVFAARLPDAPHPQDALLDEPVRRRRPRFLPGRHQVRQYGQAVTPPASCVLLERVFEAMS